MPWLTVWIFKGMIHGYRWTFSWFMGGQCRFYPTCSAYALEALDMHGLRGLYLIAHRLLRCRPGCRGGLDPVPAHE